MIKLLIIIIGLLLCYNCCIIIPIPVMQPVPLPVITVIQQEIVYEEED
jgi:hypothetical protein